jgi:hypothetical protein
VKRVFSDWFEVPGEWKSSLRADLERDPPILGSTALGGQTVTPKPGSVINSSVADGANIALEKLAATGQIGTSGVEILANAIRFAGDLKVVRGTAGRLDVVADGLRLGALGDIDLNRSGSDQLDIPDKLRLTLNLASATLTPLWVNVNGTVYQVQVGAAGSGPGGVGRALWIT